jgi:uncharacterized membrane protein
MSHLYLLLKLVHVIGSAVLFGTGLGIAFFMVMAHRSGDPAAIAHTARIVVIADALFTATAVVVQPLTGWAMAVMVGYSTYHFWINATLVLYVFVGLCWLPVVWIQLRLRDLAAAAARDGTALPARYHSYFRLWFALGWPAFAGVLAIFVLMLWKPQW